MWPVAVDGVTAEVTAAFEAAGIPSLLLKGPTIAQWLHDEGARSYSDTDLLVAPESVADARLVLSRLGFAPAFGSLPHPGMESPPSAPWRRGPFSVDLHESLPGAEAPSVEVWELLEGEAVPFEVGGRRVRALAEPGRLAHIAMHAAHHGPDFPQPLADLEAALERGAPAAWKEAARISEGLGASDAFAEGLSMSPAGSRLLESLGRERRASTAAVSRDVAGVPVADGVQRLWAVPGAGPRARMLAAELFPSPAFMRWWSPLARRSRRGLALAYGWRMAYLLWRTPSGVRALARARRQSTQFRRTP